MLTGEEHYGRLTLDCHLTPPAVDLTPNQYLKSKVQPTSA